VSSNPRLDVFSLPDTPSGEFDLGGREVLERFDDSIHSLAAHIEKLCDLSDADQMMGHDVTLMLTCDSPMIC